MPAKFRDPARRTPLDQTATLGPGRLRSSHRRTYGTRRRPGCNFRAEPCLSFPVPLPAVCRRTLCFSFPASLTSHSSCTLSPARPLSRAAELTVQRHELPDRRRAAAAVLHELHLGHDDVVLEHRAAARAHRIAARRVQLDVRAAAAAADAARHVGAAGPRRPPAAQQPALRPRPSARKARRTASVCAALSRGRRRHARRFVAADSPRACGPRRLQRPRPRDQ